MRVALVTPFYPPDMGGIADHVFSLANLLSRRHRIRVIANVIGQMQQHYNSVEYDLVRIPAITPLSFLTTTLMSFRVPLKIRMLVKSIKDFKPDLIHAHGHHYPITWISSLVAKSNHIPFILTLHGMYALFERGSITEEFFNYTIFKWLLNNSDGVIALTPTMASYVNKYRKNTKIFVIPNGVNLQLYWGNLCKKSKYRKKYGIDETRIVILYRGRFVEVKGILELVEAIKILNRDKDIRKNVLFLLVGGGPLKKEIIRELRPFHNVMILNWTSRKQVHELYLASDILVLPSKWHEAFPIVTLEAMAANLYVVSSRMGSLPDIFSEYSKKSYLESLSPKDIAKTLKVIIANWNKISHIDGLDEYIKQFDWSRVVQMTESAYQQILEKRHNSILMQNENLFFRFRSSSC